MLKWVETTAGTSRPFLKAEIVNLHLDFMDLCEGRFWGGHQFYFQLKFTIHERTVKDDKYTHQLLAPNGIHIYCVSADEAKELAEVIYKRIISAISEQSKVEEPERLPDGEVAKMLNASMKSTNEIVQNLNEVLYKKFCRQTKHKCRKLWMFLDRRGIIGRVFYSRLPRNTGWKFVYKGYEPVKIGSNYQQAVDMIQSGALDFYGNTKISGA